MEINKFNFLRWEIDPGIIYEDLIPNPFLRDNRCPYMPVFISGEPLRFNINLIDGIDNGMYYFPERGPYRLNLMQGSTVVLSNIAPLNESKQFGWTLNSLYCPTATFPVVAPGIYQFAIIDIATGNIQVKSNPINVNPRGYKENTSIIIYGNRSIYYNFRYPEVNNNSNQFRIHLTVSEPAVDEVEQDLYTGIVTGKIRSSLTRSNKLIKFDAYYFDKKAHEALAVAIKHDYFQVNGKFYVAKGAYKDSTPKDQTLGLGSFEAYDMDYSMTNKTF